MPLLIQLFWNDEWMGWESVVLIIVFMNQLWYHLVPSKFFALHLELLSKGKIN